MKYFLLSDGHEMFISYLESDSIVQNILFNNMSYKLVQELNGAPMTQMFSFDLSDELSIDKLIIEMDEELKKYDYQNYFSFVLNDKEYKLFKLKANEEEVIYLLNYIEKKLNNDIKNYDEKINLDDIEYDSKKYTMEQIKYLELLRQINYPQLISMRNIIK